MCCGSNKKNLEQKSKPKKTKHFLKVSNFMKLLVQENGVKRYGHNPKRTAQMATEKQKHKKEYIFKHG